MRPIQAPGRNLMIQPDSPPTTSPTMLETDEEPRPESLLPPLVDPVIDLWATMQGPYIPLQARNLLGFIGRYCRDRDQGTAMVTEGTLAQLMDLNKRQVVRLVKGLLKSRHLEMEKVPAANGYEQNLYTLRGVYTNWTITMPKEKVSQEEIWELQRQRLEDEEEKAALRAQLAEALERLAVHEPEVTEKMSLNGSSSSEYIYTTTTTTGKVTEKMSPSPPGKLENPVDQEAVDIEAALQDRWHVMGQRWRGGFPTAARWYTQKGPCRNKRTRENCDACNRFPDAEHPHRLEFWRQWHHAELDAAKPLGYENSISCSRCGKGVAVGQVDAEGRCGSCVELERLIDEEKRR